MIIYHCPLIMIMVINMQVYGYGKIRQHDINMTNDLTMIATISYTKVSVATNEKTRRYK